VFGDEVLFSAGSKNSYTIQVTSPQAKVLAFNKTRFLFRFPSFTIRSFEKFFYKRHLANCDILEKNLETRGYLLNKQKFID